VLPRDQTHVAIWFLRDGYLEFFAFVDRNEGVCVATRLRLKFGVAPVVHGYWYEPTVTERRRK
jgi:hypothetical protein